jgi:TRAP-type C4-dicarboxylate transport system permease small subunit
MPETEQAQSAIQRLVRSLHRAEDVILAVLLSTMIALAFSQIVLRNLFDTGLTWSEPLLRVLVLWVALLGALAATRDDRHITIDALLRILSPKARRPVQVVTRAFTAIVCGLIAYHSLTFVRLDYEAGITAFARVPAWVVEAIIPISFALIGLRYALLAIDALRGAMKRP